MKANRRQTQTMRAEKYRTKNEITMAEGIIDHLVAGLVAIAIHTDC